MARLHLFKAPVQPIQKQEFSDPLRRWSVVFAGSVALHALLMVGTGLIVRPAPELQATLISVDLVANNPGDTPFAPAATAPIPVAPDVPNLQSSQPLSEVTPRPINSGSAPIADLSPPVSSPIASPQAHVSSSSPNPYPFSPAPLPRIEASSPSPQTINAPTLPISPTLPTPTTQTEGNLVKLPGVPVSAKPTLYAAQVSIGALSLRDVAEQGAKPKMMRQEFTTDSSAACPTHPASGAHFGQPVGLMITVDDRGQVVAGDTVVQEPVDRGEYDRLAVCVINTWKFEPASNGGSAVWSNVLVRVTVDGL